jgi:glutamine synthetase type III
MVFVEIGAASKGEILAKYQNMYNVYENTVKTEANCLLSIMGSEIIPRCYEFLRLVEPISRSERINKRSEKFLALFEELLEMEEVLKEQLKNAESLNELSSLREKVGSASNIINKILEFIPKNKNWPEYEDFIHIY